MSKWTIVTTARDCYMDDWGNDAYSREYITDDALILFKTKEEAFNKAVESAESEVEGLNADCEEGVTFGIPEDDKYQANTEVKIYGYGEDDNTELVTRRTIKEVKE